METLLTRKDALTKIHNEILTMVCRNEIDIQYYKAMAENFNKKTPEYKKNIEKSKEQEGYIFWNRLLLKTVEKLML